MESLPNFLPETLENHGSLYEDLDGIPDVSALCSVDSRVSEHYILRQVSTYTKTTMSHWTPNFCCSLWRMTHISITSYSASLRR